MLGQVLSEPEWTYGTAKYRRTTEGKTIVDN